MLFLPSPSPSSLRESRDDFLSSPTFFEGHRRRKRSLRAFGVERGKKKKGRDGGWQVVGRSANFLPYRIPNFSKRFFSFSLLIPNFRRPKDRLE